MPERAAETDNILVLGVGNEALGDEGFGIHVVRKLKENGFPEHIRIEAGGVAGFDLLGLLSGVDRLIIVDVMVCDLEPGDIGRFNLDAEFKASGRVPMSFHELSVLDLLQIAEVVGLNPRVEFLVTKPVKLEWGFELSPLVQQAADKAVDYLVKELAGTISES
ncbi:hydrogenase maturation protease [Dehalogenimonas sp. THU2]|uniref:hydrogenase maturation protease n=1 Tax=Dehalogenimonas sp. THU2 TaxID=3151121 RepID=UPI0032185FA5